MSRRQAAPKPEELIQKLDDKLEAFKTEVLASLEQRTADISKLQEDVDQEKSNTEKSFREFNELLSKETEETNLKYDQLQKSCQLSGKNTQEELNSLIVSSVNELKEEIEAS